MHRDDVLTFESTATEHHERLKSAFDRTMKQDPNYTTNLKLQAPEMFERRPKEGSQLLAVLDFKDEKTNECAKWEGW